MDEKASLKKLAAAAAMSLLASCKPPASDTDSRRTEVLDEAAGPSRPIASPDSKGAIWSPSTSEGRIIYGQPGSPPFLALACKDPGPNGRILITRYAPADENAGAFLALIGNGHVARIPVDASWNGRAWVWEGVVPAISPELEVLTGLREVTATIPGAGELALNPSHAPAQLITQCRGEAFAPAR